MKEWMVHTGSAVLWPHYEVIRELLVGFFPVGTANSVACSRNLSPCDIKSTEYIIPRLACTEFKQIHCGSWHKFFRWVSEWLMTEDMY
jgi:hypothetical protein